MIVACDVDGVLAALHTEWYRRYNRDFGDDLTLDMVTGWDLHRFVKPECGKRIYDYLSAPDLYEQVPVIDGAVEGVRRLRALGHHVLFVTSCVSGMTDQKAEWLIRHGFIKDPPRPGNLPSELIVAHDKQYVAADILLDDGGHNVGDWILNTRMGMRRAMLFDYPHNKDFDLPSLHWQRCHRVAGWTEALQLFEQKAA